MGKLKELFIQTRNEYLENLPLEKREILDAIIQERFEAWTAGRFTPENATITEWELLKKPTNENRN